MQSLFRKLHLSCPGKLHDVGEMDVKGLWLNAHIEESRFRLYNTLLTASSVGRSQAPFCSTAFRPVYYYVERTSFLQNWEEIDSLQPMLYRDPSTSRTQRVAHCTRDGMRTCNCKNYRLGPLQNINNLIIVGQRAALARSGFSFTVLDAWNSQNLECFSGLVVSLTQAA